MRRASEGGKQAEFTSGSITTIINGNKQPVEPGAEFLNFVPQFLVERVVSLIAQRSARTAGRRPADTLDDGHAGRPTEPGHGSVQDCAELPSSVARADAPT
jgi:hypothetical protein